MPLQDHYDNPISTTSQAACDHYIAGVDHFLAATYGAQQAFEAAITADPGFALGHAAHARALMMAGDMAAAKTAIATAQSLTGGLSPREASHIACFAALLEGRAPKARALVREHAHNWPRDVLVVQLCASVFGLIGFSGKVGREADLLAYTTALMPHYGEDWWMMSMHAISLCETGQAEASQTLMERSLALNGTNANASHFKAHAMYESGQAQEGRAFLDDWMQGYDKRGLLFGHLSWHRALWALHAGDINEVWAAIDGGVGPGDTSSLPLNILTDTAAILYRAELAGHDVPPERWSGLSDYAVQYFPNTGQSFADMHAALAHAMAGQGDRLARIADTATGFAGDLVRPVAAAWQAIARQDWSGALQHLVPVLAQTERLGGSRAQRDLIELAYVNALMKLGQSEEAHRALSLRRPVLAEKAPVTGY